jgi:hypothetical protein
MALRLDGTLAPPGYASKVKEEESSETRHVRSSDTAAFMEKAMVIAKSPLSAMFGMVVMMFMMGGSLSIFSVFIMVPMMAGPFKQLWNFKQGV